MNIYSKELVQIYRDWQGEQDICTENKLYGNMFDMLALTGSGEERRIIRKKVEEFKRKLDYLAAGSFEDEADEDYFEDSNAPFEDALGPLISPENS